MFSFLRRRAAAEASRTTGCSHLGSIQFTELPDDIAGCKECLASGDWWVHLRMCQSCGHIGCCDDSPNKHASAHVRHTGHPIIRSAEPGEDWSYCYIDDVTFVLNR
jgi:uncharacterized UBP type Zn finger protein